MCPLNFICRTGSKVPSTPGTTDQGDSIQPSLYASQGYTLIALQFSLVVGTFTALVLLTVHCWKKLESYVKEIDLYQMRHNYHFSGVMVLRKNTIGGIFSIIFLAVAVLIIGEALIEFVMGNIKETKSLVPLVILQSDVTAFVASEVQMNFTLLTYGDSCAVNNSCSPLIFLSFSNMQYSDFSYACMLLSDKTCIIAVLWTGCIIETGAVVEIAFREKLSYATGLIVNVSSSSSIPSNQSSVLQSLYSMAGFMFIGSAPSQFYFTLTPSLFRSESSDWPSQQTGYHVSSQRAPVVGSQYLNIQFPITLQLNLAVHLEKDINGLYTIRTVKQSALFMIFGLFGSVFGVMHSIGAGMHSYEGTRDRKRIFMAKRQHFADMRRKGKRIKYFFGVIITEYKNEEAARETCTPITSQRNISSRANRRVAPESYENILVSA